MGGGGGCNKNVLVCILDKKQKMAARGRGAGDVYSTAVSNI